MTRTWHWPSAKNETASGIGNWEAFHASPYTMHDVIAAARGWSQKLAGADRLWLCWNVDPAWCLIQQALVQSVGWTPLVGFDPRVGPPPLLPGAIGLDFNEPFGFRTMYPHFPLDYAFLFADRLAFWHSDLLLRRDKMIELARRFESMRQGEVVATLEHQSFKARTLRRAARRAWELTGCMTREGSLSNFEQGFGWWSCFYLHPMCQGHAERQSRVQAYWDHGTGILYWGQRNPGRLSFIPERHIQEGHFTRIGREGTYKVFGQDDWRRNLSAELSANFSLEHACKELGLADIFDRVRNHLVALPG